jgi:predicted nuclease of predicted toxin-antitoxin system
LKLLFDLNLSPRLVTRLADLFPDSSHVQDLGLGEAVDDAVDHARHNGFCIVSKDEDYNDFSLVRGSPPKVIWLLIGNCTTDEIETLIRSNHGEILAFEADPHVGTLALG